MTHRKRLLPLLIVLALLLALAGCRGEPDVTQPPATTTPTNPTTPPTTVPTEPELTAEGLMAQVAAAIDGRTMSQMTLDMVIDLGIKLEMEGFRVSMDTGMDLDIDAMISDDPYAMYMDMTMQAESMGESVAERAQAYYLTENGSVVCYMYTPAANIWSFLDTGMTPEELSPQEDDSDTQVPSPELTLDAETQTLDRREVYVLRCTLTSEHLSQFMTPMTGSMITPLSDESEDLPDGLSAPTVIWVDTETLLPVKLQMDITGIEDYLNDQLSGSTGIPSIDLSMGTAVEDESDSPLDITINTFRIVLSSLSFEPAEIPPVPQEAYDYLEMAAHDPDMGDGSYVIVHTGTAAQITPLQGWSVWDMGFDYLYIENDTQPCYAVYTMYSGVDRQGLIRMILNENILPMQEMEAYEAHEYGDRIGKFDTMYARTNYGVTMYYAWAPMADGWLLVTVQDETGGDMYEILTPLLEAAENHEPLY